MPLLLYGLEWEREKLWKRSKKLPLYALLILTAILAFVFEYVFPRIHSGFTGDWLDVALYFIGTLMYYTIRRNSPDRA
jgi:hypothetical protein